LQKIYRKPAVLQVTGWSNSTLYCKIQNGLFPRPIKLGSSEHSRAVGWLESEVLAYQQARIAERDAAAGLPAEPARIPASIKRGSIKGEGAHATNSTTKLMRP
jgi:prophage regulatory protein